MKAGIEEGVVDTKPKDQTAGAEAGPAADGSELPKSKPFTVRERRRAARRTPRKKERRAQEAADDRLLRLRADFDNFRKRTLREKNELYKRANEDIMDALLPVLDHMDLALASAVDHDAPQALIDGFRLVSEQMTSALKKFGLAAVEADGSEFDPELHEAISHLDSEDVPEGCVITQVRKGYKLGDRLLRPARVVVSSGRLAPEPRDEGN